MASGDKIRSRENLSGGYRRTDMFTMSPCILKELADMCNKKSLNMNLKINLLRPYDNYLYYLVLCSVTLYFAQRVWVSYDSPNNSDGFLKQRQPVDLCNGEVRYLLCGTDWILKYYWDELWFQRVCIIPFLSSHLLLTKKYRENTIKSAHQFWTETRLQDLIIQDGSLFPDWDCSLFEGALCLSIFFSMIRVCVCVCVFLCRKSRH
jgi:hypothetical protein